MRTRAWTYCTCVPLSMSPLKSDSCSCFSSSDSLAHCLLNNRSLSAITVLAATFVRSTNAHTVSSLYTLSRKLTLEALGTLSLLLLLRDFLGDLNDALVLPWTVDFDSSQMITSLRASRAVLRSIASVLRTYGRLRSTLEIVAVRYGS